MRVHSMVFAAIVAAIPLAGWAQTDPPKPAADVPKKTEPKKTEPKKTEPKKTVPKKTEPRKSAPKKDASKPGPMIEKGTVTEKGTSPFTLTDKDGKPVATSPDAYDVGSAATPPKKR